MTKSQGSGARNGHYDIIVVGGGHNGLVCAAYLARAGRRVLVLEAAAQLGGAAITREIAPGFRVSACAHLLHMLHPRVIDDLALADHGLRYSARRLSTAVLGANGGALVLPDDDADAREALSAHSRSDAEAWSPFRARTRRIARVLQPLLTRAPPRLGTHERADRLALLKAGWSVRRLGRENMRELLRIAGMNIADLLEETFETEAVQGALALDAVLGTRLGPRSPTSVLTFLYRLAHENGNGRLSHPAGGLGALTEALAKAARSVGAEIRTGCAVEHIVVENDRAGGVVLDTGETITAGCVVSNADPRRTFLELLGPEHLDAGFVRKVRNIRMRGTAAKLNLALDALPSFAGLDTAALGGRLLVAPGIGYVERAFDHAKYGEVSAAPAIEITLPSLHDTSLAPEGKHVLSAIVQYAPYDLRGGWDSARDTFADAIIRTLAAHAPDLESKIVARELITPLDLEREFRMTGGHWHHGELAFDQFLMLRPVPGAAQYATPVPGLYLCGAGAHPGGGVTGVAGMNAARRMLSREAGP
ncbi:MAG: NAD(P)/FAD-dependent oxidoreductase [Gammaproteobacteria bacterium]|nr:NAD(P)/FAD-dependent oxidoreductase [Gammaproteobacteria bacterium]NIR83891.1 NAD(P)/FAD-dependent oxidoreductase [Gammaproteobacteria bacterium]NIR90670.1 NAD(P)/FAD-dependent oxidoreductase [Gammaproteobacteria bacterium]NIV76059.1 FAD-dependent oxidoreductase [Gammaproteobacteria bacterium]